MKQAIILALEGIPEWLRVIVLAGIPIAEFRLSIPVGIFVYELPIGSVIGLTMIGGGCIFLPLFFGLEALRRFFERRVPVLVRPIDALLARGQKKLEGRYAQYGMLGLMFFVSLPLPLTGVWTATLGAVALKIPFRQAAIGILMGLFVGCVVMTGLSLASGEVVARI